MEIDNAMKRTRISSGSTFEAELGEINRDRPSAASARRSAGEQLGNEVCDGRRWQRDLRLVQR
jgi:hypothetical protein